MSTFLSTTILSDDVTLHIVTNDLQFLHRIERARDNSDDSEQVNIMFEAKPQHHWVIRLPLEWLDCHSPLKMSDKELKRLRRRVYIREACRCMREACYRWRHKCR